MLTRSRLSGPACPVDSERARATGTLGPRPKLPLGRGPGPAVPALNSPRGADRHFGVNETPLSKLRASVLAGEQRLSHILTWLKSKGT